MHRVRHAVLQPRTPGYISFTTRAPISPPSSIPLLLSTLTFASQYFVCKYKKDSVPSSQQSAADEDAVQTAESVATTMCVRGLTGSVPSLTLHRHLFGVDAQHTYRRPYAFPILFNHARTRTPLWHYRRTALA